MMMNESTTTRVTATVTIDINQFENIKFDVDVDLSDLEGAKRLIKLLHSHFHKLCEQDMNKVKDKLVNQVFKGKPIDIVEYQNVTENNPSAWREINESKKAYKRSPEYKATLQPRRALPDKLDEELIDLEEPNNQ